MARPARMPQLQAVCTAASGTARSTSPQDSTRPPSTSASAIGIYSNLLVRTLIGYNHVAGAAGNIVVPDLATNLGTVSKDGLTYTFHLKSGIKFGPPLNREITSKDVLFAFERIGTQGAGPGTASTTT